MSVAIYHYTEARIHTFTPFRVDEKGDPIKSKHPQWGINEIETVPVTFIPGLNQVDIDISNLLEGEYNKGKSKALICESFKTYLDNGLIRKIGVFNDDSEVKSNKMETNNAVNAMNGCMTLKLLDSMFEGETRNPVIDAYKVQRAKIVIKMDQLKAAGVTVN